MFRNFFPILEWLPNYPRHYLKNDLIAGLTVGIMLIPQGMAYGMLAGLPPIYGLYAALVPMFIYVFLGTSRQMVIGPAAMVSLLVASGVGQLATAGSEEYISLVLTLSLVVGAIQLLFSLFRLGFFIHFLSHPVLSGFISAGSIIIFLSQLKNLTGIQFKGSAHNAIEVLENLAHHYQTLDVPTLLIGLGAIALMLLFKRIHKSIPTPLIIVILGILLIYYQENNLQTVSIVGAIPEGLPSFKLPTINFTTLNLLGSTIFTIALISILESIVIAKAMQARHKDYELLPNQELAALGIANMIGAFFQAFPAAGSFSRTAVNDEFGAKSGISALLAGVIVIFTLLFLTPLFYYLPKAILAAIIMVAVIRLIDIKEAIFLWKSDRTDFYMLIITFLATLLIGIEQGILIGIFISLLMLLYKATKPHIATMGRIPNTTHYKNLNAVRELEVRPDILIIRPDAPLFFANIGHFKDTIQALVLEKKNTLALIIINADILVTVDSSAIHGLKELMEQHEKEGIIYYFTGVSDEVYEAFRKGELLPLMRGNYFFENEQNAVDYYDKQVIKAKILARNGKRDIS